MAQAAMALTNKQPPKPKPLVMSANLPFDAGMASQRDDIVSRLNQQNLNSTQQLQNNNINAATQGRQIIQAEPGIERNLLNHAAGRGMAFSSGYGTQFGQAKDQYANNLADLARKLAQTNTGVHSQQQMNALNAQYMLDRLMQQQAMNASNKSSKDALSVAAAKSLGLV